MSTLLEARLIGVIAVALAVFGIAAIYSASSIWAVENGQSGRVFALRQAMAAVLGIIALRIASRTDYRFWQRHAWALLGAAAMLLIIPILPFTQNISPALNGARRWVSLGPLSIQPSELAKFAVVAWTAMLATKKADVIRSFKRGLLPFVVVLVPLSGFILLEPDLSTASLTVLLAAIVVFSAGARIGHFLLISFFAVPALWHEIAGTQYRIQRIFSFLGQGQELAESGWQIKQSLIGIGAGGLFGVGFGQGLQKLGYLPYAYSDFIFSTIGEEWGFVGTIVIVALYACFIALGFRIARAAPDRFGMLFATGLTSLIGVTAILHVAVTLSLVPTTGLPLPFLSYGRSNLIVSLVVAGVLINIGGANGRIGRRR
ncbi:MAG: FtsW/RodA/SpoVE family cell cycle protein [Gemmatimonadales bacterium]